MKRSEFNRCVAIAQDGGLDLTAVNDDHLYGCGLKDFEKCQTTILPVVKLLRYQCCQFNGGWDAEEMNEMWRIARYKFELVGIGSDEYEDGMKSLELIKELCETL